MSDESNPEEPAGEPALPESPVAQPWNPAPWATAPPEGWTSVSNDVLGSAPLAGQDPGADELAVAEPPQLKRRWLRRTLVSLVVLVTITGLVWGAMTVVDNRREERERKAVAARLAAEKKAEAAYVAAVKPLAIRLFDAVQPIQDVWDASGHRRPGYPQARDDVIQSGGSLRDLKALKSALARLRAPVAYTQAATRMTQGIDNLISAVTALTTSSHEKGNSRGRIPSFGLNFQALQDAELRWTAGVGELGATRTWPIPSENRHLARGRKAPTIGGFIMGSDFACGKAYAALELEDYRHPEKLIRSTYPKISAEFRTLAARLKSVSFPSRQRSLRHRLELGWTSLQDVATQLDAISSAFKRLDVRAYDRGYARLREAGDGLEDLALAYKSVGVDGCFHLLTVDGEDKGGSSKSA